MDLFAVAPKSPHWLNLMFTQWPWGLNFCPIFVQFWTKIGPNWTKTEYTGFFAQYSVKNNHSNDHMGEIL